MVSAFFFREAYQLGQLVQVAGHVCAGIRAEDVVLKFHRQCTGNEMNWQPLFFRRFNATGDRRSRAGKVFGIDAGSESLDISGVECFRRLSHDQFIAIL